MSDRLAIDALPPAPDSGTLDALSRPERRIEAEAKVTGAARFVADLRLPGMLHAAFVTSPVAHGRILSVRVDAARAAPGVVAVLTGADVAGRRFGRRLLDRPILCDDVVRFVGDRIVAVAAETPDAAARAAATVEVDIEPLPAILDPSIALAGDAPVLHPDAATYVHLDGPRPPVPHPNLQGIELVEDGGDVEAALASAAHCFEHEFRTAAQHAMYLEPHACLAHEVDGVIRVFTTNKAPYNLRKQLSAALGIPADRIDVHAEFIGGDFGGKGYSVDEFAAVLLAQATGRPVRCVTDWRTELRETAVRHPATIRLRSGVDAEGRLLAHHAVLTFDGGAYAGAKPRPGVTLGGAMSGLGAYHVPTVRIEQRVVYTNHVPAGHVRAPGEVQAIFAAESHLDLIAESLGIDRLELRRRNAVRPGQRNAAGEEVRDPRATEVLDELAADAAARPLRRGRGRGFALAARHVGVGRFPLRGDLRADGRIVVTTGMPDQGSGGWTVIRRTIAAALSIDEARVEVQHVSTSGADPDQGIGSSRSTHIASRAALMLAEGIAAWLDERVPAAVPDASPSARLRDDALVDDATGRRLLEFGTLAGRLVDETRPVSFDVLYETGRAGEGHHDFVGCSIDVDVDRETGTIRVADALLVVDVGTIINPIAHRGQLEGGFVFGLGQATTEEVRLDDGPRATQGFEDVKLLSAADVPPLRIVQLPTSIGPGAFGSKMAGELTNTVVAPAVANAIAHAAGVRLFELPLSAERVHAALRDADSMDPSR